MGSFVVKKNKCLDQWTRFVMFMYILFTLTILMLLFTGADQNVNNGQKRHKPAKQYAENEEE